MASHRFAFALALGFLGLVAAPRPAGAQWTLPQGDVVVGLGFDFQYANTEFFGLRDEPRSERPFPLRGEYFGSAMNLSLRAGFTDDLELELLVPLRVVSYGSDPVLLIEQEDASLRSLDFYQENVIQLARTTAGLADVQFAARYRWLASPFLTTTELRLKVPGGYDGPAGTFGERPNSVQDFAENVGVYVRPENVQDDVTLGDGQVDITLRQHFGAAFPTRTFVAGDVGYALRLDGAGDQLVASVRAGQLLGGVVMVFLGASMALSVEQGRVIGISVAAVDPLLPARDYGGTTNLLLREVLLQRDWVDVYGGVIVRLSPEVELKASYSRIVWGRNVAAVNTFNIGIAGRAHLFEPAPPPPPEPEPEAEPEVDELEPAEVVESEPLSPPEAEVEPAPALPRPSPPPSNDDTGRP